MAGTETARRRRHERSARLLDGLLGTVLAIATFPVVVLLGLASAATYRAWPFFVQDRIGRHGRPFRLVKIRTLPPSTPTELDKHRLDLAGVPSSMRRLRHLHLDELPQLWHVVSGHMALVGPRPEMPVLHAALPPAFAAARTTVRPGCTGLWQLGVDCVGLIGEAPAYDLAYLAHRSRRLDLWILRRTLLTVLGMPRPIDLGALPAWIGTAPVQDRARRPEGLEPDVAVSAAVGR